MYVVFTYSSHSIRIHFLFPSLFCSEGITTLKEIAGTMRSELPVDKDTIPSTRQVRTTHTHTHIHVQYVSIKDHTMCMYGCSD